MITQAEGDQDGPQENLHEGNELGKWSRMKKEKVKHFCVSLNGKACMTLTDPALLIQDY